jgi:hypothetical protein
MVFLKYRAPLQIGDLQRDMAGPHPVVGGGKLRQRLFESNRLVYDDFHASFPALSSGAILAFGGIPTYM